VWKENDFLSLSFPCVTLLSVYHTSTAWGRGQEQLTVLQVAVSKMNKNFVMSSCV
jgi:hypothetical protein